MASGNTALTESGRPLRPSQTMKNTSLTPRLRRSVSTLIQNFADSPPPCPGPRPEDVPVAVQVDPDGGVVRLVADLPITHFDVDCVDEDRRIDRQQRPGAPGLHVLHH